MEIIQVSDPVVHYIWNPPAMKHRTLLCQPLKVDAIVEIMARYNRATTSWKDVNCPKCLEARKKTQN